MYTFIVYGDSLYIYMYIYIDQLITGVCHIVGAMVAGFVRVAVRTPMGVKLIELMFTFSLFRTPISEEFYLGMGQYL